MKNKTSKHAVLYIAVPTFFESVFSLWYMFESLFQLNLKFVAGIPIGTIEKVITVCICFMLLLQIIFQKSYGLTELCRIAGITVLVLMITMCSGITYMLTCWLFIAASREIRFDRVARIAYFVLVISTTAIILLHLSGVIPQIILYREGRARYSLGFSHPNILGMRLFQIAVLHTYLRGKKLCRNDYLFLLSLAFFVWRIPNCQTAYIGILVTAFLFAMQKYVKKSGEGFEKLFRCALRCVFPVLGCISIGFMVIDVSKYKVLKLLDTLLAFRFSHAHLVYRIYGVNLFGQKVNLITEGTRLAQIASRLFLDNGYAELLIRYGIVFFALFAFSYYILMRRAASDQRDALLIILSVYAVYGLMEGRFVRLSDNIFLLLLSEVLYKGISKEERKMRIK